MQHNLWYNRSMCKVRKRDRMIPLCKIAVFSNMYPSKEHPTYGIFVKNQVELLKKHDVDVDVIAIDDPKKGKVAAIKKYLSWFLRSMLYVMKNKKKLSLTHSHYAFPTGYLSLLAKKWFGIPYIVTVHGGDLDKMAAKNARIAKMTKNILQQAHTVITVGEKLREDVIHRFGVAPEKVELMSMGVDTSVFAPMPKQAVRRSLSIPVKEKSILYIGNMIEAKGILDLIEAFDIVSKEEPEAVLYLIGSSKDAGFMEKFNRHSLRRPDKTIHMEPKPQQELAEWMVAADVFVLPSHHEGFGLVALEAMSVGTPVVATNVGGLSSLLRDGAGVLVEPHNPSSLAEGLLTALRTADSSPNEAAEHRVKSNSYDVIAERLIALYDAAAKGQDKSYE